MGDLEHRLRQLAASEQWPPTPELAPRVAARIRSAPSGPRERFSRRPRRALAVALAALAALPVAAVALPGVRDDVLEWLGLRDVEVRRSPEQPRGRELRPRTDLGPELSLRRARELIGFEPLLPAALKAPHEVRVNGRRLSLVYRADGDIRLLITEQPGREVVTEKFVGPATSVRAVRVDGARGAWVDGRPHAVVFQDERGRFRDDALRLAGDTLVWESSGLVLRIEGAPSLRRALRIATSLRPMKR